MIHGQPDDQGFGKLLSADEWKRLSWVFGSDALAGFLGESPRGICLRLGFGEEWLDEKLKRGKLFKLCIFPSASVSATQQAVAVRPRDAGVRMLRMGPVPCLVNPDLSLDELD